MTQTAMTLLFGTASDAQIPTLGAPARLARLTLAALTAGSRRWASVLLQDRDISPAGLIG
jgi:hypothetical protein